MRFEWDENKRQSNLTKHGFDFRDARLLFSGLTLTFLDERYSYDESRYITMGMLRGVVVVMIHTEHDEVIRVISMRRATKHEQEIFFRSIAD